MSRGRVVLWRRRHGERRLTAIKGLLRHGSEDMSGAAPTKRILKTTVAAAAAGAVVLSPLSPLAQEAGRSRDPLSIGIGQNAEFTRVEFGGVIGVRTRVSRQGDKVVVRLGTTAAPDVSRLKVDPPAGVKSVETRVARAGGTDLIITLQEGADARSGVADGAVWLNLYAPGKAPQGADAAKPQTTQAVVPVKAETSGDKTVLTFQWDAPVGAAVFRRGDAVWIVFDTPARMDMTGARQLGPARDARWAAGPGYTAMRIAAPETMGVAAQGAGRNLDRDPGRDRARRHRRRGGSVRRRLGDPGGADGRGDQGDLADRSAGRRPVRGGDGAGARQGLWRRAAHGRPDPDPHGPGDGGRDRRRRLEDRGGGRSGDAEPTPGADAVGAVGGAGDRRPRGRCAETRRLSGHDRRGLGHDGRGGLFRTAIVGCRTRPGWRPSRRATIRARPSRRGWRWRGSWSDRD